MVKIESTEAEIFGLQVPSMIQAQVNPGSYISHNANKPNVFASSEYVISDDRCLNSFSILK